VVGGVRWDSRRGRWLPGLLRAPDRWIAECRYGLEQSLHDGAATGMSAVAIELDLIAAAVGDPRLGARIDAVRDTVCQAVDELRHLGSAIYPPVLGGAGLEPAWRALAERRGLRLRLDLPGYDIGEEARARTGLLVADYLHTLSSATMVLVRVRGRRFVRVRITEAEPGRSRRRYFWGVLRCA